MSTTLDNPEMDFSKSIHDLDGFLQDTCTGQTPEETAALVKTYKKTELDKFKTIITKIRTTPKDTLPISDGLLVDLDFFLEATKWDIPCESNDKDTEDEFKKQTAREFNNNVNLNSTFIEKDTREITEDEFAALDNFLGNVCAGSDDQEIRNLVAVQFQSDIDAFYDIICEINNPKNKEKKALLPVPLVSNIDKLSAIEHWNIVKVNVPKDKPEMVVSQGTVITDEDIDKLKKFMSKTMNNKLPVATQKIVRGYDRAEIKDIRRTVTAILYPDKLNQNLIHLTELRERTKKFVGIVKWRIKQTIPDKEDDDKRSNDESSPTPFKKMKNSIDMNILPSSSNALKVSKAINNTESNNLDDLSFVTQPPSSESKEVSIQNSSQIKSPKKNDETQLEQYSTRGGELYCIKKPQNTRKQWAVNPRSHIVNWQAVRPAGYGVYIDGPEYHSGCVKDILTNTKKEFGEFKRFHQDDKYTLLVMTTKAARDTIMDIINNDVTGLEAKIATYRFPQIKISVHKDRMKDPKQMVKEIHMFNFKNYLKHKFELFGTHQVKNSPYITLIIQVDPQIRSYISDRKQGKIWHNIELDVVDHFTLERCYTCGHLGHFKCKRTQPVCIRCSLHHQRNKCTATTLRCPTCSGNHEAFTLSCDKFRQMIDNEMDKVDYDYTNIMIGRCF